MLQINGVSDHIHILIGTQPNCNLSDLMRDVKASSSKWIDERNLVNAAFSWQYGFGAFTVSHSQLQRVTNYIINQEEHHKKQSFRQEYIKFLNAYKIQYDDRYIFE